MKTLRLRGRMVFLAAALLSTSLLFAACNDGDGGTAWTAPATGNWTASFSDDFSTESGQYTQGELPNPGDEVEYRDGALEITASNPDNSVTTTTDPDIAEISQAETAEDENGNPVGGAAKMSVEADVTYVSGPPDTSGLLICTAPGPFDIGGGPEANGTGLAYLNASEEIELLDKREGAVDAIEPGDTRHVVVDCLSKDDGSTDVTVRIDGEVIAKGRRGPAPAELEMFGLGGPVLFVAAGFTVSGSPSGEEGSAVYRFDNLVVHTSP